MAKAKTWLQKTGMLSAWCPVTPEENNLLRLAAVLESNRQNKSLSKGEFIRQAAVAAATKLIELENNRQNKTLSKGPAER